METKIDAGDAAYSLYENSIIQAYTHNTYHISGGQVTPGTDANQITVAVEAGEAQVNDTNVSWTSEELVLEDGGVGPSGQTTNDPRVDVIFVKANGALGVATGKPTPYAPDTDQQGDPLTPSQFEHWEPAPDDGTNVGGATLALVLVEGGDTSAGDIASGDIKQWKLGTADLGDKYVLGNGEDNGPVTITVNDADFTVRDNTDATSNYLWRDHNRGRLFLGTANAQPTLRAKLDANGNAINGVEELSLQPDNLQNIDFSSGAGQFALRDISTGGERVIEVGENQIEMTRATRHNGKAMRGVGWIQAAGRDRTFLDFRGGDGTQQIWTQDDGSNDPAEYSGESDPSGNYAYRITSSTDGLLFGVDVNGMARSDAFEVAGEPVATEPWVNDNFLSLSGGALSGNINMTGNRIKHLGGLHFNAGGKPITFGGIPGSLDFHYRNDDRTVFRITSSEIVTDEPIRFTQENTAASVENGTVFKRTDGVLTYKDDSGNTHALY